MTLREERRVKKLAIIVNGKPESGKDFLCDAVTRPARKISSIDPIVPIAKLGGWDGVKTKKSRKLLSDLKRIFTEFNDLPTRYALEEYHKFLQSEDEILFVHIREPDQIEAFKKAANPCVALLIRRAGTEETVGNVSDDGIDKTSYDCTYENDKSPGEAGEDFRAFISRIFERYAAET